MANYNSKNKIERNSETNLEITKNDNFATSQQKEEKNERKRMKEELRQSEERFRLVFENTALGIAIGDPTGHIIKCNQAFQKMLGYTEKELFGKAFSDFTYPEDSKKEWRLIEEIIAGKRNDYKIEKRYIRKDGQIFWGQTISNPVHGADKETIMAIATIEDISERKKIEQELLEANQRLEAHIKNAPEAIIEFDSQYRIIRWSKEAEKIFGWSEKEIFGKSIQEIPWVYEDDVGLIRQLSADMFSGKLSRNICSNRNYRKDGTIIYCEWYNSAIYDPDGMLTSVLSFVIDVTERKKIREELEEYNKNLEALVEERTKSLRDAERLATIGATAGMVGHDIRNPLQAIISEVYLAESELANLPECEEKRNLMDSLREIGKSSEYINKIVADLQDFVRSIKPSFKETNLTEILNELIHKLNINKQSKIRVSYNVKDSKRLVTDADLLKRVLGNLMTNAVQAMPEGGELVIDGFLDSNDYYTLSVEDTGVGISEKVKEKIFEPLFTTKSQGQGFGLAVVKRLTEALGGTVTFESKEGKGTKFILRLPHHSKDTTII